jgi:hypothetical protein
MLTNNYCHTTKIIIFLFTFSPLILGKGFVDHWGINTPARADPSDPFGCIRRTNVTESLQQGNTNQNLYPGHIFPTPAYKCGYSGGKDIIDVNFNVGDAVESGSVLCGSASRVFVFGEGNSAARNSFPHSRSSSEEWNSFPCTGKPLMTSTPVETSAAKLFRTSTPYGLTSLPKGLLSPEEMLMPRGYSIDFNTTPNLRARLFTSSEASSDGSLGRESDSMASAAESSSAGTSGGSNGLWRPW